MASVEAMNLLLVADLVAPLAAIAFAALVVAGALGLSRGQPAPQPLAGSEPHRVVVVGGGFGGLQAVMKLSRAPIELTLIDRRNFHLFQPLVYQVATGGLSPGEIAAPLRAIFKKRPRVRVLLGQVTAFDLKERKVHVESVIEDTPPLEVPYDSLIVAGGSHYSYFGHDDWRPYAPEVKSLESALDVRQRILRAFEAAELEHDPERRAAWLTFAVVGAGPTGVEMAGQIAELANETLRGDFRAMDPREGRILLVEAGDRVLGAFPPSLSDSAADALRALGVTVRSSETVVGIDAHAVTLAAKDGSTTRVPARTVVWAAGVAASSLAGKLAHLTGAEVDRAGRVTVEPDLSLPGHPEVLALGDMVRVRNEAGEAVLLPGVAPVAMQQGRYAARNLRARLRGQTPRPFRYVDKGNLATIGRARAVADIKGLHFSGPLAWLLWLGIHIFYLIGFENRLLVVTRWGFAFVTRERGARLITTPGSQPETPA
jgi:NADH dehydrogenase